MTKDELIVKQALLIEELKIKCASAERKYNKIHNLIYCIGGPLNDNVLKYNSKQMLDFQKIIDIIKGE